MTKNRIIVYFAGFLFSIPIALTSYINSSFIKEFVGEFYLSAIYILASILSIIAMLKMEDLLNAFGNRKTLIVTSLLSSASLLLLAFSKSAFVVIPAFIIFILASNFILASLDIFVEDFSKNKSVGKFRGLYLAIVSFAWVLAQIVSGNIVEEYSFRGLYLLSTVIMAITPLIFIFSLRDFKDPKYIKISAFKTLKIFIKDKSLSKIYLINLILKFFFVWMIIYTPIYLNQFIGFNWAQIGFIFTIMLTPFVLLSFPLGKLSDKIGEKKMLLLGFIIIAFATVLIPLIKEPVFLLWALVLFATRVGAAIIEVMSESYFFKEVSEEDVDEISFFRNTAPVSYIIAPLFALPILLFVPSFSYLFFILGAILLLGLLLTIRLKDIK